MIHIRLAEINNTETENYTYENYNKIIEISSKNSISEDVEALTVAVGYLDLASELEREAGDLYVHGKLEESFEASLNIPSYLEAAEEFANSVTQDHPLKKEILNDISKSWKRIVMNQHSFIATLIEILKQGQGNMPLPQVHDKILTLTFFRPCQPLAGFFIIEKRVLIFFQAYVMI